MPLLPLATEPLALLLLAQSGAAKTAVGWLLVVLSLALALLVVARPSGRKHPDGDPRRR